MWRSFRFLLLTLLLALELTMVPSFGQVTTGAPPFGSFGGGPDMINLASLNSQIGIPVLHKSGRGLPFTYDLPYDTSVWYPVGSSGSQSWQPLFAWGWRGGTTDAVTGSVSSTGTATGTCSSCVVCGPNGQQCCHNVPGQITISNYVYHDPSGVPHPFSGSAIINTGNCSQYGGPNSTGFTSTTTDGSGYTLTITGSSNSTTLGQTVTARDGTIATTGLTDRNGNQITASSGGWTDTLGTTAITVAGSGTPASPMTYTYTAASGASAAYTVKYTAYTVKTNFGCSGIAEYGPTSNNLVSEIDLPDGSKYSFTYEPTPGFSGDVTGRLASVTFPTGGTISYTYSGGSNGIVCADGTAASLTRITPDGTWSYAHSESGSAWTTTVTDPQGNQTVLNFQGIYETQKKVYQGSSTSGTLLGTVYTCYNAAAYPCNSTTITLPITKITTTNSWASGQISQTVANYNTYGLPTEVDQYAFGSGSPGSLVRKTVKSYASLGNNINNLPASVSIYAAGASNPTSQTSYTYDQGTVTATSGTPQHVSVSGSRGNPTTATSLISGTSTITTTATYFDTGMVQTSTDSNNNQATYGYGASSCGNSFSTSVSRPLGLSRSATWNCNGGLIASMTDENGQVTSYSYDLMNRPAQINYPDGGWDLINYTSATQQDTYAGITSTTPSTSCTSCRHDQLNLDSSGRESSRILVSDPEGQTTTSTVYDSLGRVQKKSNPYRTTSDPTYGFHTNAYDALNRVTSVTHQDSNVISTYYGGDVGTHGGAGTQLCASGTYGLGYPVLTVDQASMKHEVWADALGRIIEADEADSSGNLTLGTCHIYDVLGNVTQTVQGSQTRSYAYDGLSRKTSESAPEAGTTSFYYTTSGGLLCSGNPQALCRRTDARGITTTYSYDAMNRMTSTTYSDSTPPTNLYYDESSMTLAGTVYTLANTKGRPSHTSAASGGAITIHSYDATGRTQDIWQCTPYNCSSTSIWKTHHAYDLAGDLTSWQHPNGETITQTISNAQRITQITSSLNDSTHPGALAQNIHYAPHGAVSTLQNGCAGTGCTQTQETYDYNNRLQPVRIQLGTSSSNNANSCLVYNYYSAVANPTSCSIPSQASTGNDRNEIGHYFQDTTNSSLGHTAAYTYDNLNRLTTSVATGSSSHNLTFSYDRYGNMTCVTGGQTNGPCPNYTFNSSTNQISNTGYSYDVSGNLIADGTGTGSHTYQWDAENRLKSIDSGSTATYTYNALGQRVEKVSGTTYTEYVYDASGEELGENNRTIWTLRVVSFDGRHLAHYQGSPESTYFMHVTRLGSTSQATDYSGALVQDQLYYPWGQEWNAMGTAQEKRFARLGHRDTSETGVDPTYFRMLSSTQGRWLSADPGGLHLLNNPQSFNRYAFVGNNPTNRIDPFGNQGCDPDLGCFEFGCNPEDPFCGPVVFIDVIRITFSCPNNKCSCCPYYLNLIKTGRTWLDRNYGRVAYQVCQLTAVECINNCTRQCLVNYAQKNCDWLPGAIARNYCREIVGHAKCVPPCALIGGIQDGGITIIFPSPFPLFIDIDVTVTYSCNVPKLLF